MSRPRWARVTAVAAATLAGGALVAFLVVPRGGPTDDPVAAGLVAPATTSSTVGSGRTNDHDRVPDGTGPPDADGGSGHPRRPDHGGGAHPGRRRPARHRHDRRAAGRPPGRPDGPAREPDGRRLVQVRQRPGRPGRRHRAGRTRGQQDRHRAVRRLNQAKAGDEVDVWTGGQRHAYRVTKVVRVDKTQLDGNGLFAVSGPRVLHLVTCTGAYVPGSGYTDNLVVIADPVVT